MRLIGGNPGRLTYSWSVAFTETVTDVNATEMLRLLNSTLESLPANTIEYNAKSNETSIFDKMMTFSVRVSNFLNYHRDGMIQVMRKNNALPRAQLNKRSVTSKVSRVITLRGMLFNFNQHLHT